MSGKRGRTDQIVEAENQLEALFARIRQKLTVLKESLASSATEKNELTKALQAAQSQKEEALNEKKEALDESSQRDAAISDFILKVQRFLNELDTGIAMEAAQQTVLASADVSGFLQNVLFK